MQKADHSTEMLRDALRELLVTYNEINSDIIDEVFEEPSPLEFMRFVAKNRPLIIRGGAQSWEAVQKWSRQFLVNVVGDNLVNVSITPNG